ncbi:MAG: hypothetical protein WCE88_06205 [Burkholderiales bacterium]
MPPSPYAIEQFISDKISKVTECTSADLQIEFPDFKAWISGYALVVIYNDSPPESERPYILQFLRRAEAAFSEYSMARDELLNLLNSNSANWSPYFRALYHFEIVVSQLYQIYDIGRKRHSMKFFKSGDGSFLDRLKKLMKANMKYR